MPEIPDSEELVSDTSCSDRPDIRSRLPVWHKPEVSRVAIARTSARPFTTPGGSHSDDSMGSTDDVV